MMAASPCTGSVAAGNTTLRKEKRRAFVFLATLAVMIGVTAGFGYSQLEEVQFSHESAREFTRQAEIHSLAGDRAGAVAASREATAVYRGLMRANPILYAPYLAASLHDLSVRLSEAGDNAGARAAIEEAIRIRRHLARRNPIRHAASLEQSRQLLSRLAAEPRSDVANQGTGVNSVR